MQAHSWLLENLNEELLSAYLNLMRALKAAGSSLSDHLVKKTQPLTSYEEANAYIREFLAPKFYEPPSSSVGKLMDVGSRYAYPVKFLSSNSPPPNCRSNR